MSIRQINSNLDAKFVKEILYISPFLFLFCMDFFPRMLQLGNDLRQFIANNLTRGSPQITRLFFTNDALLFFTATKASCCIVSNILQRFVEFQVNNLISKSPFSK